MNLHLVEGSQNESWKIEEVKENDENHMPAGNLKQFVLGRCQIVNTTEKLIREVKFNAWKEKE